jgi:hypothetical protein
MYAAWAEVHHDRARHSIHLVARQVRDVLQHGGGSPVPTVPDVVSVGFRDDGDG